MTNSVQGVTPTRLSPAEIEARKVQGLLPTAPANGSGGFAGALQTALGSPMPAPLGTQLRFSTHAQERLRSRDIQLSEQDTAQLAQAVEMAGAKGAQESLILYDDLALIVSIRNKVVITALERGEAQANVFTHIDSAVVLPGSRT